VTITSVRRVNFGTFKPNFFIILEPGAIAALPKTWVGAITTQTPTQTLQLKQQFAHNFPNALLIDIKKMAKKVLSFLQLFTNTIHIGAIFGLIIGGILFSILTKLHLQSRTQSFAMLHWTGLSKKDIHKITLYEHLVFVTTMFSFSSLISIGISYLIVTTWIHIPLFINWTGWLSVGILLYIFSIWIWHTNKKEIQ